MHSEADRRLHARRENNLSTLTEIQLKAKINRSNSHRVHEMSVGGDGGKNLWNSLC